MPEALAVVAVIVVTIVAWLGAWLHTRDPANRDARGDLARLQHQSAWLEQRLAVARREQWDADMVEALSDEIALTSQDLARATQMTGRQNSSSER